MGACFATLYAAAILFSQTAHLEWVGKFVDGPYGLRLVAETALAAVAVGVLLRPASGRLLLALAALYLACVASWLPEASNHRLVLGLVSLSICGAGCLARHDADALFAAYRPCVRSIVIVVYAFAFFVKLNTDYLSFEHSCAVQFFRHVVWQDELLAASPWLQGVAIYGPLVVEGVLPLALLWRRTRVAAVYLAWGLHVALALDLVKHFVDFSSVMLAAVSTFLPGFSAASVRTRWQDVHRRLLAPWPVLRTFASPTAWLAVAFLLLAAVATLTAWDHRFLLQLMIVREQVWLVYAVGVLLAWRWGSDAGAEPVTAGRSGVRALCVGVTALVVVNGLSPFVGLKTRTAFNMYSNLRIDDRGSNHLLVPRSLDVFGVLADRAVILETADEDLLRAFGREGVEVPYVALASHLRAQPGTQVRFQRGPTIYDHPTDPVPEVPPWLLRKLALFRPMGDDVRDFCIW